MELDARPSYTIISIGGRETKLHIQDLYKIIRTSIPDTRVMLPFPANPDTETKPTSQTRYKKKVSYKTNLTTWNLEKTYISQSKTRVTPCAHHHLGPALSRAAACFSQPQFFALLSGEKPCLNLFPPKTSETIMGSSINSALAW